jgi:hypothetical protein
MGFKRTCLGGVLGVVIILVAAVPVAFGEVFYSIDPCVGYNFSYNYLSGDTKITAWVGSLDNGHYDLPLGDFNFSFYGSPVGTVRITTNGYISFSTDAVESRSAWIPDPTPPNALVAPFWRHLDLTNLTGDDGVWWAILGTKPNRQLVIEWRNVPTWDNETETHQFEIILFETTNLIKFQYQNLVLDFYGPATAIGVEDSTGSAGSRFDYYLLYNGLAIEFTPIGGRAEVAGYNFSANMFFAENEWDITHYGWGGSDSMPLIWDFDGDGINDMSIFHIPSNRWFVAGYPYSYLGDFGWGGQESVPVPGDYNGDGIDERAIYHTPTNRWFVEGQGPIGWGWNGSECIPVPGDYDGDGKTDMMIYHIPTNQWLMFGVGNLGQFGWGGSDCIPVPADYDGDGAMEIAVYHVPSNQWLIKGYPTENTGQYGWGGAESFPIPGDYNEDGAAERAFYRPAELRWFIEGQPEFIWGWREQDFMPLTSQMAVYNWFRFMLGRFQF